MADIHLLPQKAEAADLVMPSKLGGMLASGRPVVASAAAGTQIALMVASCGTVVAPADGPAMGAAVLRWPAIATNVSGWEQRRAPQQNPSGNAMPSCNVSRRRWNGVWPRARAEKHHEYAFPTRAPVHEIVALIA